MKKEKARAYIDSIVNTHIESLSEVETMDELKARATIAFKDIVIDFDNILNEVYRDFDYEMRELVHD